MTNPTIKLPAESHRKGRFRQAWKESHGSALLGFASAIVMIGLVLMSISTNDPDNPDLDSIVTGESLEPELPKNALLVRVATDKIDSTGPIRIAIYDSLEAFGNPDKATIQDSLQPINGFVIWEIDLAYLPDEFSIAAYHDLDSNGELNRALFNAPVEPYGFSNSARSILGAPTYEQTLITRPKESEIIEIRVY